MQDKNTMIDQEQVWSTTDERPKPPKHASEPTEAFTAVASPSPQIIAERLRSARLAARLTQQELAGGLFSKSYISAVERGKMIPSLQALHVLAQRLAVPISYLLGEHNIDLAALEESSAALRSPPTQANLQSAADLVPLLDQAEALLQADQPQEALALLGDGETLPAGLPLLQRLRWYRLVGWAAGLKGNQDEAIRLLELCLKQAEQVRLRLPHAEQPYLAEEREYSACFLGNAFCAKGMAYQALGYHRRGLEAIQAGRVTNPRLIALIYKGLGHDTASLGRYQEAIAYYQEGIKHAQTLQDQRLLGLLLWGIGWAYQQCGDLFRAKANYYKAWQALEQQGNPLFLADLQALLGRIHLNLHEYEEAETALLKSLSQSQQLQDARIYGIASVNLAALYREKGQIERALAIASSALQWVQQKGDQRTLGQLQLTLAAIHEDRHDLGAAEQAIQEAIRIFQQMPDPDLLSQAHERYADFLAKNQRFSEAYEQLRLARPPASSQQGLQGA